MRPISRNRPGRASADQERASAYTTTSVTYVYSDGGKKTAVLNFRPLYSSLDTM